MLPAGCGFSPFPLKIHFKGRQLPAGRRFFKNFFCFCNAGKGILATGRTENFSFHSPTPPRFEIFQTKTAYFLFASYYGQKSKMPNAGAEKFPPHLLLQSEQGKMAGNGSRATKKAANLFQTYCSSLRRAGGGWYSVLKVWADWLDNLGFFYLTNWDFTYRSIPIKVSIYIRLSEQLADT